MIERTCIETGGTSVFAIYTGASVTLVAFWDGFGCPYWYTSVPDANTKSDRRQYVNCTERNRTTEEPVPFPTPFKMILLQKHRYSLDRQHRNINGAICGYVACYFLSALLKGPIGICRTRFSEYKVNASARSTKLIFENFDPKLSVPARSNWWQLQSPRYDGSSAKRNDRNA